MVGSYYGDWRYPMLLTLCMFLFLSILSLISKVRYAPLRLQFLLIITLVLISQGAWMLFNYKFNFLEDEILGNIHYVWQLIPNENQAFPHLPGAIALTEAIDRLSSIIPTLLATLAIALLIHFRTLKLQHIVIAIFWTSVAVALLGITQRLTGATGAYWLDNFKFSGRSLFFGTYRSPAIACCLLNLALAVGLSHLLVSARKAIRSNKTAPAKLLSITFGNLLIACGSIQSGSKAGAIFTLVTIIVWLAWNFSPTRKTLKQARMLVPGSSPIEKNIIVVACTIISITLCAAIAGTVVTRWNQAQETNFQTMEARRAINKVQINMVKDSDWGAFGFGPGSFYPLFPYYKSETLENDHLIYAHNDHLQTLVEWGWFGATGFYIIFGGALFQLVRNTTWRAHRYRNKEIYYQKGIFIGLVIISLHALIDFPFQIESIAFITACLVGVAWGSHPKTE